MPYIGAGIQRFNTADSLTVNGDAEVTGTVNPSGDTASGDAAAIGFTSTEGLILTGQGSTSDITVKNDADATVFTVPTGTDDILFPDNAKAIFGAGSDLRLYHDGNNSYVEDAGSGYLVLKGSDPGIALQNSSAANLLLTGTNDISLLFSGNAKLATTNTGVDITGGFTATDSCTITVDDNADTLVLKCTDADSVVGPILVLQRDSGSPADNDALGFINFTGDDDGGTQTSFATIAVNATDITAGTLDGEFKLSTIVNNNLRSRMVMGPSETAFNEDSDDIDFRVESNDNANMLVVDAGNNRVGIGTGSPGAELDIESTGPTIHLNDSNGVLEGAITSRILMQASGSTHGVVGFGTSGGNMQVSNSQGNLYLQADTGGSHSSSTIFFTVDNSERARFTSGGAFLINQTTNPAGNMFRVTETAGNSTTTIMTTSTSYATTLEGGFVQRAANSAYSFQLFYSSGGGDLEFNLRGDGNAFADGSFTGGGADYAEYFEWDDGNSSNEDRRGYSVVLVNNKIRKATSSDAAADIIGVVSANPSAVGDAAWNNWSGKYLRDDFGSYVTETYTSTKWSEDVTDEDGDVRTEQRDYETDKIPADVTVPADAVVHTKDDKGNILTRRKLNPDYDETLTYSPRENRQEWDTIGMVGKLRLRAGQPTGDRWIKMRDISDSVEEWLVR